MCIVISVEFGPGIRLVAPTKSKKCWRLSQPRRVTTSSSIMPMCAAGPPNAVSPSRKNKTANSRSRSFIVVRTYLDLSDFEGFLKRDA
jgi:hypothetical protein